MATRFAALARTVVRASGSAPARTLRTTAVQAKEKPMREQSCT